MNRLLALLILALTFSAGCRQKPPFQIIVSGEKATVDVQSLGEYQTTVKRIRLVNKVSGVVVWELRTQSGSPQINEINLRVGDNPAMLDRVASGIYAVAVPAGSASFSLAPETEYEIEVWVGDLDSSEVTGHFSLRNRGAGPSLPSD